MSTAMLHSTLHFVSFSNEIIFVFHFSFDALVYFYSIFFSSHILAFLLCCSDLVNLSLVARDLLLLFRLVQFLIIP